MYRRFTSRLASKVTMSVSVKIGQCECYLCKLWLQNIGAPFQKRKKTRVFWRSNCLDICFFPKAAAKGSFEKSVVIKDCP